jgi:hypothetical protein
MSQKMKKDRKSRVLVPDEAGRPFRDVVSVS